MNTLLSNLFQKKLSSWSLFYQTAKNIASQNVEYPFEISGIKGSLHSLFVKQYLSFGPKELIIVVQDEREAFLLKGDLNTFIPETEVVAISNWGTLSYRSCVTGSRIFGQRAGAFAKLALKDNSIKRIFIIPLKVFITPMPSPEYTKSLVFSLKKNQSIDTVLITQNLSKIGYIRVPKVSMPGEFSLRGEVLDIYLPDDDLATRIIFDFDKIEEIKSFDTETQTTISKLDSFLVYPMKEVCWNEELISKLETIINKDSFEKDDSTADLPFTEEAKKRGEKLLAEIKELGHSEGEELFYPALWDKQYSIIDYISDDTDIFFFDYDRLSNAQESFNREMLGMYRKVRLDFPVLLPEKLTLKFNDLVDGYSRCIKFRTLDTQKDTAITNFVELYSEPAQSYFGNINYLKEEFQKMLQDNWTICLFADNENQSLRIKEILKEFTDTNEKNYLRVVGEAISEGFIVPEIKLRVVQENEIFGRRKYVPKSLQKAKSQVIDTFVELNPGDYVVHVNYGIGLFKGIERVKALGNERDYIKLEYADEEFVFVPIEQVNMVQRYIGNSGENPALDRIGSKAWENRKNKVRKSVEDLAEKLIGLYSKRKAARGFPFPKDTEWQITFEAAFPYEDTPDQITVTQEIKKDMEKPVPMDRLLCGDVGYGKTEIAMRAAFKAVMGGKQVAFLAPTTILAEQHYESCLDRFRNFPVKIAHMSRFVLPSEQKKILAKLNEGQIDILIGTHRIIQKDVVFKNLGLMIIDEEQRFGVKDKEKLKALKNNIDCLSMSATPIPRTLHMSLLKIRDMSLLTTPPQIRKPIETVIDAYSDEKVSMAIRKEIERGGQVFYLHNRVETLNETRLKLERLLPEMMIDVAHGQMTSEQLDDIFRRFKMGGFHVLVATTIIENGIDIPNVNTIIIDRADMYGISQLYQLRGRVGRSDKKAYAYLLYPGNKSLSEIAMKRLQVISDFTELGSGFKIAMKDMEIRGAGNLLGRDQSGSVYSVGFDLYVKLLNEAVSRLLSQEDYKVQTETLMELEYTGFIPDSYVQNPQIKMEIYKKIAAIQSKEELDSVYIELEDRFGPIPDEVASLLSLAEIRILCRKLNISSIKERKGVVTVEFAKVSDISVNKVISLISESAGTVRLDPTMPNMIFLSIGKIGLKEKSEFIREKIEKIV